jgi:hypothetical protein
MSPNLLITDKTNRQIYLARSADFLVPRDSTAADTHRAPIRAHPKAKRSSVHGSWSRPGYLAPEDPGSWRSRIPAPGARGSCGGRAGGRRPAAPGGPLWTTARGGRRAAIQAGGDSARVPARQAERPTDKKTSGRSTHHAHEWVGRGLMVHSTRIIALYGPEMTKRTTQRSTSVRHMSEGFRPLAGCGTIVSTLPPIHARTLEGADACAPGGFVGGWLGCPQLPC